MAETKDTAQVISPYANSILIFAGWVVASNVWFGSQLLRTFEDEPLAPKWSSVKAERAI